jgi:hypothetical protein
MSIRRRSILGGALGACARAPMVGAADGRSAPLRRASSEPVQLTLSSVENDHLAQRVRAAISVVSHRLAGKLLLAADSVSQIDPRSSRRAVVHAVVVLDGQIRGLSSTWPPGLLMRSSQGSTSKTLGLVAISPARPHLVAPTANWAAQPISGMREADGTLGGGTMSATESVARSRNLPSAWAFGRLPDRRLREALGSAGLEAPKGYRAAIAVAYGHLQWTAIDVLTLFDTISSGKARGIRLSGEPAAPSTLATWAATSLEVGDAGGNVRRLLSAPVLHERGTARHLRGALIGLEPVAKTGTAINWRGEDVAKVLAVSFRPRPSVVATVYAAMVAPRLDQPLGTSLPTAAFAPLHHTLIDFAKEIS